MCITCMGRLHHLKRTLKRNIVWNHDYPRLEFVLLDYNSQDGLEDWVRDKMQRHLEGGLLVYYKEREAKHFIPSHAKNVCHRLASGEIVCNLDADNLTGAGFAAHLNDLFGTESGLVTRPGHITPEGLCGRIAIRRTDFDSLGGYNEEFDHGWGPEDNDLVLRARALGFELRAYSQIYNIRPLAHSYAERCRMTRIDRIGESANRIQELSTANLQAGKFVANEGRVWGKATVTRNFVVEVNLP